MTSTFEDLVTLLNFGKKGSPGTQIPSFPICFTLKVGLKYTYTMWTEGLEYFCSMWTEGLEYTEYAG